MNKIPSVKSILIFLILSTIYYIIFYAYNATNSKLNELESNILVKCISNICVEYDNIRECIHIEKPTLFKIETNLDTNYLNSGIRNINFDAIKEECQ